MTIYDDIRADIADIMDEVKQGTIQLIQVTAGAGAIDNPGAPTETTHTLAATAKGVRFKYVRDGLAVSSDLEVVAAPIDGVTPSLRDFVSIDGTRYKIVHDISAPSAGTIIVWKFIVRKGG